MKEKVKKKWLRKIIKKLQKLSTLVSAVSCPQSTSTLANSNMVSKSTSALAYFVCVSVLCVKFHEFVRYLFTLKQLKFWVDLSKKIINGLNSLMSPTIIGRKVKFRKTWDTGNLFEL